MSAERSVTAISTPAALVDAHAREREALGDLVPELLVMRDRERGSTGSTFYAATLAALVDHRWPVTALARIVGEDYASIQGRLADPGARPGLLPVNTVVPDYPEQILMDMRAARRGPLMNPAVADFVRRLDSVVNGNRDRFSIFGGREELFDALAGTYTRDGLLGIGAEAIRREYDRGVAKSALVNGLGRTYTALGRRMRMRLEPVNGWVVLHGPEDDPEELRRRYVFRRDAVDYRGRTSAPHVPGRPVRLDEVPTSPYPAGSDPFRMMRAGVC